MSAEPKARWFAVGPAVVAAVVIAAVAIATWVKRPSVADIERRANAALVAGDYPTARIWFQRLAQQDPTNAQYIAGLRLSERRTGRTVAN